MSRRNVLLLAVLVLAVAAAIVVYANNNNRASASATNVQTAQVSVPGSGGPATLDWLRAPSVLATTGVTLGSQSFGSATRTGLLQPAQLTSITAAGGTYSVELPAGSAVMLTQ